DEIKSVFFFPESIETLRNGFMEINKGINAGDSEYELSVANALWAEKTYPFLDSYIKTAEEYYSANTTNLDFINQPEESRLTINGWAEEKTHEKITDLIPEGMIDSSTRLVITNAVYFKGEWVKQFDKNQTTEADFTTASGKTVNVEMMQRTDDEAVFDYCETDTLQALKMPYANESGKELSMFIILPKENSLSSIEEYLTADKFAGLEKSMTSEQVVVFFPKFKLETEYSLSETLEKMGMPTAFSGNADFSGMDGTKNLAISDVVHKAYVDVNEEGTEAAAATAVMMRATAVLEEDPAPVFIADHPFIFMIQDDETGNIIFMGRVANPA
ncbi:MAG: serpin family protein, partial [Methanomicrobium sp.]|nr:serpin family protein [Methanomicrobium sp.]